MATSTLAPRRFTFDDVLAMVEAGILDETDRVELVDGVLVEMTPIGARHYAAVAWLNRHFSRVAGDDFDVHIQGSFVVADGAGFVMPDLTVTERLGRDELVTTAKLAIEVAQTSQQRDAEKAADYARAGVPEYWIVDLPARTLIVHRAPSGDAYAERVEVRDGAEITPLVGGPPVDVTKLLDE